MPLCSPEWSHLVMVTSSRSSSTAGEKTPLGRGRVDSYTTARTRLGFVVPAPPPGASAPGQRRVDGARRADDRARELTRRQPPPHPSQPLEVGPIAGIDGRPQDSGQGVEGGDEAPVGRRGGLRRGAGLLGGGG